MKKLSLLIVIFAFGLQAQAAKVSRVELCEQIQAKAEAKCKDEVEVKSESAAEKSYRDPYDMDQLDMSPSEADYYVCIDTKIKNAVKYYNSKNSTKLNCKEFLTFN